MKILEKKKTLSARNTATSEIGNVTLRCYGNSDDNIALIITIFFFALIQLR